MDILSWIILGGIAGWLASIVMKTDASQGLVMNIVIGIIGAFIGGLLFNMFGSSGVSGFNFYSLFVAVIGSMVCIGIARALKIS